MVLRFYFWYNTYWNLLLGDIVNNKLIGNFPKTYIKNNTSSIFTFYAPILKFVSDIIILISTIIPISAPFKLQL